MAVVFERFSIRAYAAKMRSADAGKSWPFAGDGGGRSLPPMPVRRFVFWSDEVEVKRSEKAKQRAPKKRSIMALFAVAPPVDAEEVDGDAEGDEEEAKAKERSSKEKIKRRKKKKPKVEIVVADKEKVHNSKLSSPTNVSHILKELVHKKRFNKALRGAGYGQRKKPRVTKAKHIETSKLSSRNRREIAEQLPVHGILKNQASGTSIKKAHSSLGKCRGNHESGKHVSFSGEDVILEHHGSRKHMELSQLQNLCKIFSDVLAASSAISSNQVDQIPADVTGFQNGASSVIEKEDGSLSELKELSYSQGHAIPPTLVITRNRNIADPEKTFMTESLDLNIIQPDSDLLGPGKFSSGSDTASSLTKTNTLRSQHSSSCLVRSMESNRKQTQSSVDPKLDFLSHATEFQPMGSKKSGESSLTSDSEFTSKCTFEGFMGLPLNSQGEFIKLHSGVNTGSNEYWKQNTPLDPKYCSHELCHSVDHVSLKGKFSGGAMYQREQRNWLPELHGFERMRIQNNESLKDKDQFLHHARYPMRLSCNGWRENIQNHTCKDYRGKFLPGLVMIPGFQPTIPPTMRLMGQNVTVGRSSKDSREPLSYPWPQQELVSSRSSKENPHRPPDAQSNFSCIPSIFSRYNPILSGNSPQWMSRISLSSTIGNSNIDLLRHRLPPQVMINETTNSMFNTVLSASTPPFPYQDLAALDQTTLAPSLRNLPQWLLNSNQQKKSPCSFYPPYSSQVDMHHPSDILGTDLAPFHFPYTASMIAFPVYNSNHGSFTIPDPLVHPSIIGLDHCDRSIKRPIGKGDEFMRPAKRPCSRMEDESDALTCPWRREQLHKYTQLNIITPESHTSGVEVDGNISVVTNKKDELRSASAFCSLKFDSRSRPGPIKLSAGTKHILRPSLNIKQDCPKPIHSGVPFPIGTSYQNKVTKLYTF